MTTAGWIMMIMTNIGMTGLLAWCIYRVLATKGATEHLHAPLDIDTKDQ